MKKILVSIVSLFYVSIVISQVKINLAPVSSNVTSHLIYKGKGVNGIALVRVDSTFQTPSEGAWFNIASNSAIGKFDVTIEPGIHEFEFLRNKWDYSTVVKFKMLPGETYFIVYDNDKIGIYFNSVAKENAINFEQTQFPLYELPKGQSLSQITVSKGSNPTVYLMKIDNGYPHIEPYKWAIKFNSTSYGHFDLMLTPGKHILYFWVRYDIPNHVVVSPKIECLEYDFQPNKRYTFDVKTEKVADYFYIFKTKIVEL